MVRYRTFQLRFARGVQPHAAQVRTNPGGGLPTYVASMQDAPTPPFPEHLPFRLPPELAFQRPTVKDYTRLDHDRFLEKLRDLEKSKELLSSLNRDSGRTYKNTREALIERYAETSEDDIVKECSRVGEWIQEGFLDNREGDMTIRALMKYFCSREHIPLNHKVSMLALCRQKELVEDNVIIDVEEHLFNEFIRAPLPAVAA